MRWNIDTELRRLLTLLLVPVFALAVFLSFATAVQKIHAASISETAVTSPNADALLTCPQALGFGDVVICSIDAAAEVDIYSFNAEVDDVIFFRVYRTSNTLNPWLQIFNPDGNLVCQGYAANFVEGTCTLARGGTYSLRITDSSVGRNLTGGYRLYLQRLNNPGAPIAVPFGETITDAIGEATEVDTFTLQGSVEDRLLIRMNRTSNTVQPWLRLLTPAGTLLCEGFAERFFEMGCTLPTAGTYTGIVTDASNGRAETGGYTLLVQRLNNPLVANTIGLGQRSEATIAAAAEFDSFTFAGTVDDVVVVRMHRTSNTLQPWFRMYNPAGVQICEGYAEKFVETFCSLHVSGQYTIITSDASALRSLTGNYTLYLQRVNNPGLETPIKQFGLRLTGSITPTAEVDTYTFTGEVEDLLIVRMRRESNTVHPWLRIFGPEGNLVCKGSAERLFEGFCRLARAGRYTVLVADASGGRIETGNYTLYIQRLNNPGSAKLLPGRAFITDAINIPFRVATYTFAGQVDDQISLLMLRTSNTLQPWIRVYKPDGGLLCEGYGETRAEISRCTLPRTGNYSVLVADASAGRIETGGYSLTLGCLIGSCANAPDPKEKLFIPLLRR